MNFMNTDCRIENLSVIPDIAMVHFSMIVQELHQ